MKPIEGAEPGHYYSEHCPCGPRVERDGTGEIMLIVHNSFDGAEALEEAEKILGLNPGLN